MRAVGNDKFKGISESGRKKTIEAAYIELDGWCIGCSID
jgi:hypothetical protein